jgi:hypothetical protein
LIPWPCRRNSSPPWTPSTVTTKKPLPSGRRRRSAFPLLHHCVQQYLVLGIRAFGTQLLCEQGHRSRPPPPVLRTERTESFQCGIRRCPGHSL